MGGKDGFSYDFDGRAYGSDTVPGATKGKESWAKTVSSMSEVELDQELADVYAREFGMSRGDMEEEQRRKWSKKKKDPEGARQGHVKLDKKGNPIYPAKKQQQEYLIVDGYNIIFAWQELKELAKSNIDAARDELKDILLNYQGCKKCYVLVVFDAYKVKGNPGKREWYDGRSRRIARSEKAQKEPSTGTYAGSDNTISQGIEVVYTRQDETADAYIERKVHEIGQKYKVTVATSDGLEQLTVLSMGALRMSATALRQEIDQMNRIAYEAFEVK